jgi:predicted O-methyltransferase YrrM
LWPINPEEGNDYDETLSFSLDRRSFYAGGHLYTLEVDPAMARTASENIQKMGLEKTVTVIEGDALKTISQLEGKFDFIFIDAVKSDYLKYFLACLPLLEPGAVIVGDNVIRYAHSMRDFLDAMEEDSDYAMVIIRCSEEKGDGMAVIYKIK